MTKNEECGLLFHSVSNIIVI